MTLKRLTSLYLITFLYLISDYAFAQLSEQTTLWEYVTQAPPQESKDLPLAGSSSAPILSFTTPAGSENLQISIGLTFYSTYISSSSCSGNLFNQAYNNACVCPGLSGKTFYISQDNLYKIINAFSPANISSVGCIRIRDNKNLASSIFHQTTCSTATASCTNNSGTTSALPQETTTGNACTC